MELLKDRKTQITKGIAGFSSATLIAIVSYFYSFFSEKIPLLEQRITLVEREISASNSVIEKNNKDLMEKIELMREDVKTMRQTQEKIFEILINIKRNQ